jgi:hypothetical protein
MKKSVLVGLCAVMAVVAGCGDGDPGDRGVISVTLNTSRLVLKEDGPKTLIATVTPVYAKNKEVTWESDNEDVVTVDQTGKITGVDAPGSATVTVTTVDGGKTAACVVSIPFTIENKAEWDAALAVITATPDGSAGSPKVFVLQITGDFSTTGKTNWNSSIGGDYKEVWLIGDNKTITLSGTGSLIRTAANQTFVLDGPALKGNGGNNNMPLVDIVSNSAVELLSGAIQDNTNTYNHTGGGVRVDGGTFTMEGGTVSGNTVNSSTFGGGGVYVGGGTFTMKDGTVSGNTANGYGGGVNVDSKGTFTMEGGTVSGNTANGSGGGVDVTGGTFTMEGGTVSGNTAYLFGGGVYVYYGGTFTKAPAIGSTTSGVIYGYTVDDNSNKVVNDLGNIVANSGHAVYVYGAGGPNKKRDVTAEPDDVMRYNVNGQTDTGWK